MTKSRYSFAPTHHSLTEVLADRELASLGDSFVNFVCSIALSNKMGKPVGTKVKGTALAEALKKAGLRGHAPSRMSRHMFADAAEALMAYAWLHGYVEFGKCVSTLENAETLVDGLGKLLAKAADRIRFS
ncbi:MAG: ribonuclease III family protein [Candidatus Bathyarchaeota archaeon]|nr:ribonuclease III family protein [Candidatus Bathyarchaeota archaeon]